jgi:hypothetical protein
MSKSQKSTNVIAPANFSTGKVTFSPVKTLDSGGKQAYLNYDGRPLVMQVGPLETPFGMSVFDKAGPPKYSVDLKLRGYDDAANNPKTAAIYTALHALDEFMLDQGVKNSTAWFKGAKSREVLSELYTPSVRFAKDAEGNLKPYPPTIKLQLKQREGKWIGFDNQPLAVYDSERQPLTDIPLEDVLVKGAQLTVLIQCTGVWFAGGKFGLSWKVGQIRADKVPESIRGFAFLDEDGETPAAPAVAQPRAAAAAAAPAPKAPTNSFAALHDDDDEVDDEEALGTAAAAPAKAAAPPPTEEDEDAEDAPPVPVPAAKKTITKKTVIKAAAPKK